MKLVLRIVGILAIVLVLAVVVALVFVDQLTASGIRKASTYATGTEVTLESADLGITSGTLTLDQLVIANPEGFDTDHFLSLGRGDMDVELGTVTSDVIQVPAVTLRDVSIVLERKDGKANYQVILDHLESVSGETDPDQQPSEAGSGVNIRELRIENITATIRGYPFPSEPVKVPSIVLKNVPDNADAASVAKVVGVVIASTLQAVATSVPGLPEDLAGALNEGLAQVGDLGAQTVEQVTEAATQAAEQATQKAQEATDKAGQAVEEAGEKATRAVDEAAGKAKDAIGGLLGGRDKDQADDQPDDQRDASQ